MSESQFDPNLLLSAQTTEANEKRDPLPAENPADPSGFYVATIAKVTPKSGTISKGDRTGQPWAAVNVQLKIDVPQQLQDAMGMPEAITLTDSCFLDLTPQGSIDNTKGKNRRQRQYREALGMNVAGETWSWERAVGRPLKVKVNHKVSETTGDILEEPGLLMKA